MHLFAVWGFSWECLPPRLCGDPSLHPALSFSYFLGPRKTMMNKASRLCVFSSQVVIWIVNFSQLCVASIGNNWEVRLLPSLIKRHNPVLYWWQKGCSSSFTRQQPQKEGAQKTMPEKEGKHREQDPSPVSAERDPEPSCWAPREDGFSASKHNPQVSINYLTKSAWEWEIY